LPKRVLSDFSTEASMRMKASEVGDWLRRVTGKRDHRQVMSDDDYLVLRPGPNFDRLRGNPVAGQPIPPASEQDPTREDRGEIGDRAERG
jgi:hypothetical protein